MTKLILWDFQIQVNKLVMANQVKRKRKMAVMKNTPILRDGNKCERFQVQARNEQLLHAVSDFNIVSTDSHALAAVLSACSHTCRWSSSTELPDLSDDSLK